MVFLVSTTLLLFAVLLLDFLLLFWGIPVSARANASWPFNGSMRTSNDLSSHLHFKICFLVPSWFCVGWGGATLTLD